MGSVEDIFEDKVNYENLDNDMKILCKNSFCEFFENKEHLFIINEIICKYKIDGCYQWTEVMQVYTECDIIDNDSRTEVSMLIHWQLESGSIYGPETFEDLGRPTVSIKNQDDDYIIQDDLIFNGDEGGFVRL